MSEENRKKAAALHEQAHSIEDPEVALAQYHDVLALDPHRPTTLYNIGLIHKYRSEWYESLLFNRRSVELDSTVRRPMEPGDRCHCVGIGDNKRSVEEAQAPDR